jgi:hypothetical protein
MGFQEVVSLDCDKAIQLGGSDKKTRKPNPTSIEGYYVGSKQIPSAKNKSGFTKLHVFQTGNGSVGVWGKTDLDTKLAGVASGTMTRVTYTGMKPTKNNPMYVYKVEVDSDNTIDTSALEASSSDYAEYGDEDGDAPVGDEPTEETDPGEEEAQPDEPPPARAKPPVKPAATPSAAQQAKVKALLAGRKTPAA